MAPTDTSTLINEFLSEKRFAMVGVSRHHRQFSRALFREFVVRGYDVVPVNPHTDEIERARCYPSITAVRPPVKGALLMTSGIFTQHILEECAASGVSLIWIHGISGKNVSQETKQFCADRSLRLIPGYCPYMFLPQTALYHRFHGWLWKRMGYLPAASG